MTAKKPLLAIAGASGFVGTALTAALREHWDLRLLSRSRPAHLDARDQWTGTDFFKYRTSESALEGVTAACYLVHSMLPTGRLTQGKFSDLDLLAADNFARSAKRHGVRHIVYLSGLLPPEGAKLSEHLRSRREVERLFLESGVPATILRAGLIFGGGGSSFGILHRLVQRLPVMLLPSWTDTRTQPVDIDDVVRAFAFCLAHPDTAGRAWDLGVPESTTYREMMHAVSKALDARRHFFRIPLLSPRLSRLWVSTVTGAPKSLVAPLVESLKTDMVVRDGGLFERMGTPPLSLEESLRRRLAEVRQGDGAAPQAFHSRSRRERLPEVRSVQRLPRPGGWSAAQVAEEYFRWLQRRVPFVRVRHGEGRTHLCLFGRPLLVLRHAESSFEERALYYVEQGRLVAPGPEGRFEFRLPLTHNCFLLALHDFRPGLPWWMYRFTQAVVHASVAKAFGRSLRRAASQPFR